MTPRAVLLAVLACTVVAGAAFYYLRESDDQSPQALQDFFSRYERVREAEKIADPMQRCMAYPSPPEFHWDADVIEAFCRLSTRKMLAWQEIKDAVDHGQPEILEKAFDSYLAQNYQPGEHGYLIWTFRSKFWNSSDEVLSVAQKWVDEDPHSAFALVARGMYFASAAWNARGTKVAAKTLEANFARMEQLAGSARADFKEALRRSPRLIAAYHGLAEIAHATGDEELLHSAVRKGLALDPADQWIYDDWANAVQPQWGGSLEKMQAVADRAKQYEADNPLLKRVEARRICSEAESALYCESCGSMTHRRRTALALYRKAAQTTPAACFLLHAGDIADWLGDQKTSVVEYNTQAYRFMGGEIHLLRRALALQKIGKAAWGIESLDIALADQPKSAKAFNYKGWIFEDEHLYAEAEKAFRAAQEIEPANREANTELVVLYTGALHDSTKAKDIIDRLMTADKRNPRAWLLLSVLHKGGDEKLCQEYLEKYLELVDQDNADSYEQRDIDRAKKRLAEIKRAAENRAQHPRSSN